MKKAFLIGLAVVALGWAMSADGEEVSRCGRVIERSLSFAAAVTVSDEPGENGGPFAYLATVDMLRIFDIADLADPVEVGSLPIPGRYILDVQSTGTHAYVSTLESGVWVVDVSNPRHPKKIGALDGGCGGACPNGGAILVGPSVLVGVFYSADWGESRIRVFDLGNPARPLEVASIDGPFVSLAASGSYLFASRLRYPDPGWSLDVIDLSEPRFPRFIGSYENSADEHLLDIAVDGETGVVTTFNGISVIDLSDPSEPIQIGAIPGRFETVAIAEGRLHTYTVGERPELQIIDLRQPAEPVVLGSCGLPYHGSPYFRPDQALIRGHVVLAHGIQGMIVVDARQPSDPRIVAQRSDGAVTDVALSGNFAFWLSTEWRHPGGFVRTGLRVSDVSDPRDPVAVGWFESERRLQRDIAVSGSNVVLVGDDGLTVIDVSRPSAPLEVGTLDTPAAAVALSGPSAVLATTSGQGLVVVDLSDPSAPREVATLDSIRVAVEAVAVSGSYAYVAASGVDGFAVIDISDPSNPYEVSTLDMPEWRSDWWGAMVVEGSTAYVAAGQAGLVAIDIGDPAAPREVFSLPVIGWEPNEAVGSVAVMGSKAYIGTIWAVRVVDLEDPHRHANTFLPYVIPFRSIPFGLDIAAQDRTVYVADSTAGSTMLDLVWCDSSIDRDHPDR